MLLAVSLAAFALGFTNILWAFGKPVGAICFGLFMIFKILDRETAVYDEEQALRLTEATRAFADVQRASAETGDVSLKTAAVPTR